MRHSREIDALRADVEANCRTLLALAEREGLRALAEETEKKGTVKVWFPNTVGVPEEFARVKSIILDIIPCHLLTEFYFRFLTWRECETQRFTWRGAETAGHTWESFQKAVADE